MIRLDNVSLTYGEQQVLRQCSFAAAKGEHVALMGTSGSGKTTLLRCVAGLQKADSGQIRVEGRVAYVFQEPRLLPWLTAEENIAVVLEKDSPLTRKLLAECGLADAAGKYPHELSGGMQQRVAIARALAYDAEILLLDEALKGLDEALKDEMLALIARYTGDKTLLLATHDRREAEALCERVLEYRNGAFV